MTGSIRPIIRVTVNLWENEEFMISHFKANSESHPRTKTLVKIL